ncbi:hypothetical protein Taro_016556, partial [Colocasia esculenta]|nr:hypothetical protein [Colocasia esculenta]
FTHFCLGSVDTRSKQVDTSPRFQKTQLPDWDSRSTLAQSRSYKPYFQEEGQGNQGESLERSLLCKAKEQIQLKRRKRRRISGISDAIKAEHRHLRRISIDFHQGSSIEASARPLHRRTLFLHPFPSSQKKSPVSPSSSFSKEAQRKGAKEIHKHFMANRSLNESRKSTIHKVLALTAHSKSSEHSSSSSEHKSSNGSKRSSKSTPDPFVYSNSDSDEDESMSYAELIKFCKKIQSLNKLQAILSRGRTRESRGIPGEKLAVQGKGADPTEEAQEKKDFWHFRCHQSRASPFEENLHRFPSRLLN